MNFQLELEKKLAEADKSENMPKLLLHSCCGPCSSYVASYLMEHFDVSVFFYNPNIFPSEEFMHRMQEQKRLIDELNKKEFLEYELNGKIIKRNRKSEIKFIAPPYKHEEFLEIAKGFEKEKEGGKRCERCFRLRLEETEKYARENNFNFFATTLSVSPHKNAVLLNEIGTELSESYLVSDFKKKEGYKTSIIISKIFDLYRQTYCGCEFALNQDK